LAGAAAADAPVEVQVTLEPPVIPFHRQARYTIAVDVAGDIEVKLPDMIGKFGGVDVHDVKRDIKPLKGERKRVTETYILDPILAATYPIAPAQVLWGEGSKIVLPSPALRVRNLTEAETAAAERFEPIAGPVSAPKPFWLTWPFWAALCAGVVLVVCAVMYWLRRRERIERATSPPPAWQVAYERLRELDQRQLAQSGNFEVYYVDLSAILRYYIEDRFQLRAPEQTTPEFLGEAASSGVLSEVHQRLVASFLRHCDRVKFAQYRPMLEEMERGFEVVLRFVDETVPEPKPVAEEEAA